MKIIQFEPNKPQSFIFDSPEPYKLPGNAGGLYTTSQGELLHCAPSLVDSLALLRLEPGESVRICLYLERNVPHWVCDLTAETEKARARKEVAALGLEAQLGASLRMVRGGKSKGDSSGEATPGCSYLAPTGTEGPAASPAPSPRKAPVIAPALASSRTRGGPIPLNVAFREIVRFVVQELNESGEQWSDQCRQDLVSTVMIAAQKAGLLGVWEREAA